MATITEIPVTLSKDEILRYSRHLIMPEVGMEGQKKLKAARAFCASAQAGWDRRWRCIWRPRAWARSVWSTSTWWTIPNLRRQIIHSTADVGRVGRNSIPQRTN